MLALTIEMEIRKLHPGTLHRRKFLGHPLSAYICCFILRNPVQPHHHVCSISPPAALCGECIEISKEAGILTLSDGLRLRLHELLK